MHGDEDSHQDHHHCSCTTVTTPSVHQTLEEMDFHRGIWQAALDGDVSRIKALLDKGTDVNIRDVSGYTALHYSARQGNLDATQLLLQRNADPNAKTKAGNQTPLHRAAHEGHTETIRLLLEKGALIDSRDVDGRTALHKAAERGKFETCELLISHNCHLKNIPDRKELKPYDLAADEELKKLLKTD